MDRPLIAEKLESLRRCLARVQARCPDKPESLANDLDAQDIVALNLTRAVQISVDIAAHILASTSQAAPETMAAAFDRLAAAGWISGDLATRLKNPWVSAILPSTITTPSTGISCSTSASTIWMISANLPA